MSERPNHKPYAPKVLTEPYWVKQKDESGTAFQYFVIYRDLPYSEDLQARPNETPRSYPIRRRTMEEVSELAHRHIKHIERIARKWRWKERVHAYDMYVDAERRHRLERERQKYDDTALLISKSVLSKLAAKLLDVKPQDLELKHIAPLFKVANEAARTALGQPIKIIEHQESPDVIIERRMRLAVSDIIEMHREKPEVPIEDRVKWSSADYELDFDELYAAVQSTLAEEIPVQ